MLGSFAAESTLDPAKTNEVHELPVIHLATHGPMGGELRTPCSLEIRLPASMGVTPPLLTNLYKGSAKFHGATSQGYDKKSFGISLEAPLSFQGLPSGSHWVLNAAYIDRSLMRHKLSYDLFLALNQPKSRRYAAASRFVEVFHNGKYRGVYLLMQRVDRTLLGLTPFSTNNVTHACIYKAVDHSANFFGSGHSGFEQREPDPLIRPFWTPLDQLNTFITKSSASEFSLPVTGIRSRLDVDNARDFHLLLLLTSNMDGSDKNFIIARDKPSDSPNAELPKFFFVPWDYDATFGRNWDGTLTPYDEWLDNHLLIRLLRDPQYRQDFVNRWEELSASQFSVERIHAMIDENVKTLGTAVQRNAHRWPTESGRGQYPDDLTFSKDVEQMKDWVAKRVAWLNKEIPNRFKVRN